jgi:kynurenine formamidase
MDFRLPVHDDMPVYPVTRRFEFNDVPGARADGLQASQLSMSCHAGTHLDVPRHYLPAGKSVDELDPGRFTGPALIAAAQYNSREKSTLEAVDLRGMVPGDSLLLATGWDQRRDLAAYYQDIPQFAPGSGARLVRVRSVFSDWICRPSWSPAAAGLDA